MGSWVSMAFSGWGGGHNNQPRFDLSRDCTGEFSHRACGFFFGSTYTRKIEAKKMSQQFVPPPKSTNSFSTMVANNIHLLVGDWTIPKPIRGSPFWYGDVLIPISVRGSPNLFGDSGRQSWQWRRRRNGRWCDGIQRQRRRWRRHNGQRAYVVVDSNTLSNTSVVSSRNNTFYS